MPSCPKCRARTPPPTKTWSMLGDPNKKGEMQESIVGIYECAKCGTKFPHVFGRQKLMIVKAKEWEKLQKGLTEAQTQIAQLEQEKTLLQAGMKDLEEKLVITELQAKADVLQKDVTHLREGRKELEEEISAYTTNLRRELL